MLLKDSLGLLSWVSLLGSSWSLRGRLLVDLGFGLTRAWPSPVLFQLPVVLCWLDGCWSEPLGSRGLIYLLKVQGDAAGLLVRLDQIGIVC